MHWAWAEPRIDTSYTVANFICLQSVARPIQLNIHCLHFFPSLSCACRGAKMPHIKQSLFKFYFGWTRPTVFFSAHSSIALTTCSGLACLLGFSCLRLLFQRQRHMHSTEAQLATKTPVTQKHSAATLVSCDVAAWVDVAVNFIPWPEYTLRRKTITAATVSRRGKVRGRL